MQVNNIKPGAKLKLKASLGKGSYTGYYVRRERAIKGVRPAINYIRFPAFKGLNGPDDDGTLPIGDYELSRRGRMLDE